MLTGRDNLEAVDSKLMRLERVHEWTAGRGQSVERRHETHVLQAGAFALVDEGGDLPTGVVERKQTANDLTR